MELRKLLVGLEGVKAKGDLEIDITGITRDSREVKEGNMFVAIKGFESDGHDYLKDAIANGAKAIVIEDINIRILLFFLFSNLLNILSDINKSNPPLRNPIDVINHGVRFRVLQCSMAGANNEKNDAAVITPAAKPMRPSCHLSGILRNIKPSSAPMMVAPPMPRAVNRTKRIILTSHSVSAVSLS